MKKRDLYDFERKLIGENIYNGKNRYILLSVKIEDEFCDLYYINQNIEKLQVEKVSNVDYKTKDKINEIYNNGLFKNRHFKKFLRVE